MNSAKAFTIPKVLIWDAYQDVKKSKGGPGADGQTMEEFEGNLKNNLYRIWNRMSSGSYIPPPVLWVEIPKPDGGIRQLGIPTISDRIAQAAVKRYLEPKVEPFFHDDSYGYRPGRSALDAVATARQRCWRSNWVLDLDISAFFDTSKLTFGLYTNSFASAATSVSATPSTASIFAASCLLRVNMTLLLYPETSGSFCLC